MEFRIKLTKESYKKGEIITVDCYLVNNTPVTFKFSSGFDYVSDGFQFYCKDSLGKIVKFNPLRFSMAYLSGSGGMHPNGGKYQRSIALDSLSAHVERGRYTLMGVFTPRDTMFPAKRKKADEFTTPEELFFDKLNDKPMKPAESNIVNFTIR